MLYISDYRNTIGISDIKVWMCIVKKINKDIKINK